MRRAGRHEGAERASEALIEESRRKAQRSGERASQAKRRKAGASRRRPERARRTTAARTSSRSAANGETDGGRQAPTARNSPLAKTVGICYTESDGVHALTFCILQFWIVKRFDFFGLSNGLTFFVCQRGDVMQPTMSTINLTLEEAGALIHALLSYYNLTEQVLPDVGMKLIEKLRKAHTDIVQREAEKALYRNR